MPLEITNLINRLGRTIHCLQFAQGLNPAQWEALRFLSRANRYSRTPSALAEYLQTTKGTASQTLKCLETKGYVRRVPVPEDRRAVRIDITDNGRAVLRRDPLQCLDASASTLGKDTEAARRVLTLLTNATERAHGGREFGLCEECTHFCKNATAGAEGGPHKCGLTGDPLSAADSTKICVNHRA
jgi:DNA-binding MarR family transcriptional regulator